ncbi:MAG: hypothetical protein CO094_06045 [Anaerolineae bacterium CG_4_9_14_3_um_filter_57_17]|nr:HAMP domain-containing histidine kinase [bacterium]NCT21387.1 HAMP domain-containing histidine kinase [bacterium]OIO83734.1 MAG: hypothetical protein AUK01_12010 [Anaerolineae bacterium CG2_30_57_67]PJB66777.1 MAG: hypothetical protein CO094_06045 [Anaerolineae bacterium CG_4_9_14_3_um_filter_57_17]
MTSLRSRLWLTYALLVLTALSVVAAIFVVYLVRNPLAFRQAAVKMNTAQKLLVARQGEWADLPPEKLQTALQRFDSELDLRLLVLTAKREPVADSRPNSPTLEIRRLARLALTPQTAKDAVGNTWLFATRRLDNGNFLVTAVPRPAVSALNILTDELLPPLLWGGALALALALFLAYAVARWVADPLQRLVNAAGEFSGGQAQPLALSGPQEVRDLLGAFNAMTRRVQTAQESQKAFVANVSHELKTPLTSIQGFAQALLDGTAETPAERQQAAQIIYDEAARLHRLALGLLDLARLDAGTANLRRERVDLRSVLIAVTEKFSPLARAAGLTLTLDAPALPALMGDGDRLVQVFTNLVENALKFTPSGGQVKISARGLKNDFLVEVADTGPGIAPAAQAHIFERFYQADASRQAGKQHGAGLGLAIAQEIVRVHGGKINLRSTPGQGSVFSVFLPGSSDQ